MEVPLLEPPELLELLESPALLELSEPLELSPPSLLPPQAAKDNVMPNAKRSAKSFFLFMSTKSFLSNKFAGY
jgi:hypothetical protein